MAAVDENSFRARRFLLNAEANVEVDLTALDALDRLYNWTWKGGE